MDRAEKAIKLWPVSTDRKRLANIGVNREEMWTMRKVMRESNGNGGPWFKEYAEKNNLL